MSRTLSIAMFVGNFPVVSETFIVRQIAGLLNLGHEVDIYADCRVGADAPVQPEVTGHRLLERTTFMDMPPETAPWEMPVRPILGRVWPPGSATSVNNAVRVARAVPKFFRCFTRSPGLAIQALNCGEYRYQAASLSALYRLARLSRVSKRYDVLHAHFGPVGNSFRFARDLFGAPLVVSFHGYDFSTVPRKEGSDVYRKLFATADAITANSGFTRENVARLGCPAGKIHHLPVGFDPNEFPFRERSRESDKPVRILTVGRLVEIKGHEYLIRAVARLCERHPHIRCDIAGDGPLRKKLEELVGQLALRQSAVFHGPVGSVAVRQLMQDAHLFVLPSVNIEGDQEGQGLALQEAQASGLPVIATEHGALPEGMLPGESGLLVPERDVDALAEKLSFLIEHPELWPEFGRKGRAFVEARYDIRDLSRRLVEIYEGAIGSFRSTRDGRC